MDVSVTISCDRWKSLDDAETTVCEAAAAAFRAAIVPAGDLELSVVLGDDYTVAGLNRSWRGTDGPTNVLSFPVAESAARADDEPRFIGDIIVASGVVTREASDFGKPLATHLSHLIVHGVLHLMGYDHHDDRSAKRMQATETAALALMGMPDPYEEQERTAIAG